MYNAGKERNATKEVNLVHSSDESVDGLSTVTSVTTLGEVGDLLALETAVGVRQLEGPEEVGGSLEVGSASGNLVNNVLDREDTVLAEVLLNNLVVGNRNALTVNLGVSTLVDEIADGLEVGWAVGDVRLYQLQHLRGSFCQAHKDTVVDLKKSEELQDLSGLGCNVVDTTETHDEHNLGLTGNVEVTLGLGGTTQSDLFALSALVFFGVLLSTLEDDSSLGEVGLWNEERKSVLCTSLY